MLFRQLFDTQSSTTYLIADEQTKEAALVDPVIEQVDRDLEVVRELGLTLARTVASEGGPPSADRAVRHGDVVRIGSIELPVPGTPRHTDETVSYRLGDRALTGDSLLVRATGRTELPPGFGHAVGLSPSPASASHARTP